MLYHAKTLHNIALAFCIFHIHLHSVGAQEQENENSVPSEMQHLFDTPVNLFTWGAYVYSRKFQGSRVFETQHGRLELEQYATVIYDNDRQQIRILFHLTDGYINQFLIEQSDRIEICDRVLTAMRNASGVSPDGSIAQQNFYTELFSNRSIPHSAELQNTHQWMMENTWLTLYLAHILVDEAGERQHFSNYMCCGALIGTPDDIIHGDHGQVIDDTTTCP